MNHHSLYSRVVVFTLMLSLSGFIKPGASFAQDISGGASFATDISGGANVLLASADVEAKFGKGIFSRPQNQVHAPKRLEKKTVTRSAHPSHPQRQTTAGNRPQRNPGETKPRAGDSSKPLADPPKHVPNAADYNRKGDA